MNGEFTADVMFVFFPQINMFYSTNVDTIPYYPVDGIVIA